MAWVRDARSVEDSRSPANSSRWDSSAAPGGRPNPR